jgi:polysaccharide export outer membrane protein
MRQTVLLLFMSIAIGGTASVTPAQQPTSSTDAPRKCVAVIGAVHAPGRFELKRRTRLLELLSFAGGFTTNAGPTIHVTSSGADCSAAAGPGASSVTVLPNASPSTEVKVRFYRIEDINTADESKNPYVEPGDIVVVDEGEQVYITGAVIRPQAITLRKTITLTQALTMAGGLVRDAKTDDVRIIRQGVTSGTRVELKVDLKKIRKKRAEDVILQPNDIVEVPWHHGPLGFPGIVHPIYDTPVRGVIY